MVGGREKAARDLQDQLIALEGAEREAVRRFLDETDEIRAQRRAITDKLGRSVKPANR